MDSLVDGRFSLTTESGVLGGIRASYKRRLWCCYLAQGLVCGFYRAIFYLLLVGGWRMGGRGGRGHGRVTFRFWYLAAGTAREACGASGFLDRQTKGEGRNRDIVMRGPAGQANEGL